MFVQILIGTTNPAKADYYRKLLSDYDVSLITLADLHVDSEPDEVGTTLAENAAIKARHYGRYFDSVICADSGLYFLDAMPMDDPRQPGLHVRTPHGADHRLNDEEMIAHYAKLVHQLGAPAFACWMEGQATYNRGELRTFHASDEAMRAHGFYMTDVPTPLRRKGFPLDSLSLRRDTMRYYLEENRFRMDVTAEVSAAVGEHVQRLIRFLTEAFRLKHK